MRFSIPGPTHGRSREAGGYGLSVKEEVGPDTREVSIPPACARINPDDLSLPLHVHSIKMAVLESFCPCPASGPHEEP